MADFVMPSLGADMTEGRVVEWYVKPGDTVRRGDIVAAVDTSKAEIDIEIFGDGVIEELLVPIGATVPVGAALARVGAAPPAEPAPPEPVVAAPAGATPATELAVATETVTPPALAADGNRRIAASPVARRLARSLGVDLAALRGTGPHGAICKADVERAAAAAGAPRADHEPAAAPPAPQRAGAMREAIGRLMARSSREAPHYYLATDIVLDRATRHLQERNLDRPVGERLLPAALLLAATARAARAVPRLNGHWVDGGFRPAAAVHLGVAVALRGGGLVAPAIHDADTLPAEELMRALRDLVHRARGARLRAAEMRDPTMTVTNLGDQGVREVFGVIYAPQVALVGFGRITERPWASDGLVGARPVVTATLAADHRASDGHDGAQLLSTIDRLLQDPEEL